MPGKKPWNSMSTARRSISIWLKTECIGSSMIISNITKGYIVQYLNCLLFMFYVWLARNLLEGILAFHDFTIHDPCKFMIFLMHQSHEFLANSWFWNRKYIKKKSELFLEIFRKFFRTFLSDFYFIFLLLKLSEELRDLFIMATQNLEEECELQMKIRNFCFKIP